MIRESAGGLGAVRFFGDGVVVEEEGEGARKSRVAGLVGITGSKVIVIISSSSSSSSKGLKDDSFASLFFAEIDEGDAAEVEDEEAFNTDGGI